MEKYGVACECASGSPNAAQLVKTADGSRKCGACGMDWKLDEVKLKDQVVIRDNNQASKERS